MPSAQRTAAAAPAAGLRDGPLVQQAEDSRRPSPMNLLTNLSRSRAHVVMAAKNWFSVCRSSRGAVRSAKV
jgi:hypothetical protein